MRGSSPLTRGKLWGVNATAQQDGLIPAHAGKTCSPRRRLPGVRAHPRSRGENTAGVVADRQRVGSSPLTRGKQNRVPCKPGDAGLIPAHAGKTTFRLRRRRIGRAHPRSRGENLRGRVGTGTVEGSSPLTRGKPARQRLCPVVPGLIPAHAGKTIGWAFRTDATRAHPRSRGENSRRGGVTRS